MLKNMKRSGALALAVALMAADIAFGASAITATSPTVGAVQTSSLDGYVNSGPGTVGVFAQDGAQDVTIIDGSGAAETQPSQQETGTAQISPIQPTAPQTTQPAQNGTGDLTPGLITGPGAQQTVQPGQGTTTGQQGPGQQTAGQQTQGQTSQTGTQGVQINTSVKAPEISSEAGALYDATTGQFLFDKNGTKAMYPASITKLMTALLAVENLSLDDTVTYSASATQDLESGAANINLTTGDTLTVRDSLYALLLKSACEVANGLAEKVSGTQAAFAERMNQRAVELGCTGTHFENASGLNGASHYTTARDMALIANAAVSNDTIRAILQTRTYQLPASKKRGAITITNGNKMINPANTQYYEGIQGGKTGYTSKAGNTLVEVADINGHRLVAVVMKSKSKHYDDIKLLFDYGKALLTGQTTGSTSTGMATDTTTGTAAPGTDSTQTGTVPAGPGQTQSGPSTGSQQGPAAQTGTGFIKTDEGTQYRKADGTLCKNEWLDLDGKSYFFNGDGIMCTGWIHFSNGDYYYFDPEDGSMVRNKWVTDTEKGKSYYLGSNGVMATNTVIDGTYRVNEEGEYVEKVG